MSKKIAFIGIGVMGSAMAKRLQEAGYDLNLFNRTHEKARRAAEATGANFTRSIEEAVRDVEVVITIVSYPNDLEEVMFGEDGVFNFASEGTIIIDMTTSKPALALDLYEAGQKRGLHVLDAPVSGGDIGAREGTLSIMVGGSKPAFERVLPIFNVLGNNINYMGGAGCGQHTKASNQIAVAGATAAMTEAIVYAQNSGLDPAMMLKAIGTGAAGSWQLQNMAPRVLAGDEDPGFFVKHFIKDMRIVEEESKAWDLHLPVLLTVLSLYEKMREAGYEDKGTQALLRIYRDSMESS